MMAPAAVGGRQRRAVHPRYGYMSTASPVRRASDAETALSREAAHHAHGSTDVRLNDALMDLTAKSQITTGGCDCAYAELGVPGLPPHAESCSPAGA